MKDEHGNVIGKVLTPRRGRRRDTVGDPFGHRRPSLHVLVKLLATITLVLAPLFVAYTKVCYSEGGRAAALSASHPV